MDIWFVVMELVMLLGGAFLMGALAQRLGQSPILGYLLTGTIIGMARALGETAPLLMIGMVAFIVDVPGGVMEPATALPVQIFMWADFAERMFIQKTSAAIIVLLAFLIAMNAGAIILRKKLERRW